MLKNAINKWRNIVADYEIVRLKGKLLLKIYDKYKTNRIKEIIKKTLNKWENNTIFIDKIKNKINKENVNIFKEKYTKDKIIIIFKSLIRNINRKNNEKILRNFLKKWRSNILNENKDLDKAGNSLLKAVKKK